MTLADMVMLISALALGAWEAFALATKTQGDTISERLRSYVKAHPILAVLFVGFSIWFPLHIFEVI